MRNYALPSKDSIIYSSSSSIESDLSLVEVELLLDKDSNNSSNFGSSRNVIVTVTHNLGSIKFDLQYAELMMRCIDRQ